MKILALERPVPNITSEQCNPHLQSEALRVWELYQEGLIREMYFREDRSEAVLILECKDSEDASAVLNTLPLVRQGLISFELVPLAAYPGFGRLFAR